MFIFIRSCTEFLPKHLASVLAFDPEHCSAQPFIKISWLRDFSTHKGLTEHLPEKRDLKMDSPNGTFNLHNTTIFHLHKGMGLSLTTDYLSLH